MIPARSRTAATAALLACLLFLQTGCGALLGQTLFTDFAGTEGVDHD